MTDKGHFTAKLSALTWFIESVAAIASEFRLHIGTKTISTIVVDTANVAMVDISMRCEGRGTATLGVDISACPILSTCRTKYRPLPANARPGYCSARPAPFLPIWIPSSAPSRENRFALMARQEHEIRRGSIDGCADGQY